MAVVFNSGAFNSVGGGEVGGTMDVAADSVSIALLSTWSATRYCPITGTRDDTDTYRLKNWHRKYSRQFFDPSNGGQYVCQEVWFCYNKNARGSLEVQFHSDDSSSTQQKGCLILNLLGVTNIDDPFDPAGFTVNDWAGGAASVPTSSYTPTDPDVQVFDFLLSAQVYTTPTAPADTSWVEHARRSLDWRGMCIYSKPIAGGAGVPVDVAHGGAFTNWHAMGFAITTAAPATPSIVIETGQNNTFLGNNPAAISTNVNANAVIVAFVTTWAASEFLPIDTIGQPGDSDNADLVWERKYIKQAVLTNDSPYCTLEVWWAYTATARGSVSLSMQVAAGKSTMAKAISIFGIAGCTDITDPWDDHPAQPGFAYSAAATPVKVPLNTNSDETYAFTLLANTKAYTSFTIGEGWQQWSSMNADYRAYFLQSNNLMEKVDDDFATTNQGLIDGWIGMTMALRKSASAAPDVSGWNAGTAVGVTVNGVHDRTATSAPVSNNGARGYTAAHFSAGKLVFEMDFVASPNNSAGAGIAAESVSYSTFTSSVNSVILLPQGSLFINGSQPGSIGSFNTAPTRIVFAVDLDNQKVWIRRAGTGDAWNNVGGHDPATNTGGYSISALPMPVGPIMCGAGGAGSVRDLYLLEEDLVDALPSGFSAWLAGSVAPPEQLELSVTFADDDGFIVDAPVVTEPETGITIAVSFLDETVLTAVPTTSLPPQLSIVVSFFDDSKLLVSSIELSEPPVHVGATFIDDAQFTVAITTHAPYPKYNIAVTFNDDSLFSALPSVLPVEVGPFYFAWVNEGETFSSGPHGVIDEDVFGFNIQQEEGDFAKMSIIIRNPRVGLLSLGRKRWAFLSVRKGDALVPLFYGRIVGIPSDIFRELVTLEFIARPHDFVARKRAVAETLRTLPYWDPVFIDPDSWEDDDTVLEARTANWAIDRVTHEVTISDLVTAEDDVLEFTADGYHYDNMSITLGAAPLRSVKIVATMGWNLWDRGGIELTPTVAAGFGNFGTYNLVTSFTFEGLAGSWPKQGAALGDGWSASAGSELVPVTFQNVPEAAIPYFYDASTIPQAVAEGSILYESRITDGEYHWGLEDVVGAGYDLNFQMVIVPVGYGLGFLGGSYEVDREMGQQVIFTMNSDVQDVLTLAPESDVKVITLDSNPLSDLGYAGEVPIGDSRNRDYIRSPRGQLSVQHLALLARANLVAATRVVVTGFETDFFSAVEASMRKGGYIENERIPGGALVGKIKSYNFSLDGATGRAIGNFVLASTVGRGGSYTSSEGEPVYVDDEYSVPEYQEYKNEVTLIGTGDITYTLPPFSPFDDGIDFKNLNVHSAVKQFFVTNKAEEQRAALLAVPGTDQASVSTILETIPTQCHLQLIPMSGGPYVGIENIVVSDLVIPQQIDLESAT